MRSGLPPITDDPALTADVAQVRAEFLAARAAPQPHFDRLALTLLVRDPDGAWRRGSVNGEALAYPASCVKLAYLAAALHWCRQHQKPYDALDADLRPMMTRSDNVATGRVVDILSGAPNVVTPTAADPIFEDWLARRRYTQDYVEILGLAGGQRLLHKTYPSNSGEEPVGYEQRAIAEIGSNQMAPRPAAELALSLVLGLIEPEANAYVRDLMAHERWEGGTPLGFGLPPGSVVLNKAGCAYDTLEDIAYIKLPNAHELCLACFSNAFCDTEPAQPEPYELSILGVLAEMLLDHLGLADGGPPKVVATSGADNAWRLALPAAGWYEVCVRYPETPGQSAAAPFTVRHADGQTTVTVDQRHCGGRWVRLGDYRFEAGGGVVALRDGGGEGPVAADAVKATGWPAGERRERPVR
jgi:protein phosphatase methylesterase 1